MKKFLKVTAYGGAFFAALGIVNMDFADDKTEDKILLVANDDVVSGPGLIDTTSSNSTDINPNPTNSIPIPK